MGNDALSSGDYQSVQYNGHARAIPLDSCCDYDGELRHDNGLVSPFMTRWITAAVVPSNQSLSSVIRQYFVVNGIVARKEQVVVKNTLESAGKNPAIPAIA
jgi:hypothetical protein